MCGAVAEPAEVEPGAEATPGAGEDHDPGIGVDGAIALVIDFSPLWPLSPPPSFSRSTP